MLREISFIYYSDVSIEIRLLRMSSTMAVVEIVMLLLYQSLYDCAQGFHKCDT